MRRAKSGAEEGDLQNRPWRSDLTGTRSFLTSLTEIEMDTETDFLSIIQSGPLGEGHRATSPLMWTAEV